MPDIRTITILPIAGVSGVQQVQGAVGAGRQAAAAIGNLTPGTLLSGFIINRDAAGNPILRAAGGDIAFLSNFFLNIGSEVTIRVENTGGNPTAHILTVNGQPPEVAAAQSVFAQEPEVIVSQNLSTPAQPQAAAPQTATATTPAPPQTSLTVTGTLIATPQPSSANAAQPALPIGTQLTLTVTGLTAASPTLPEEIINYQPPQVSPPPQATQASYTAYARAASPVPTNISLPANTPPLPANAPPLPANAPPLPTNAPPLPANATPLPINSIPLPANDIIVPADLTPLPANPASLSSPMVTVTTPSPAVPVTNLSPEPPIATPAPAEAASIGIATAIVTANPPQGIAALLPENTATPIPLPINTNIVANAPPANTPITNALVQPGQTISATVIGKEPSGEPLLQTPLGIVRLQPDATLPTGSNVTLQISSITPPEEQSAAPNIAAATMPAPMTELAQQWTSLQQIVRLLAARSPTAGFDFTNKTMPWIMPPPNITADESLPQQNIPAGLMLFVSALRGGNFSNWLGESNVQWLQNQGHDVLLKKADGEFTLLARQFTESRPQHWQSLFFPINVGGELQQARLFIKRDRRQGNQAQGKKSEDTRFIVEVDLSQLGEMQMDGFVRKQGKDVQFDLIIRSLHALSPEMQQDIVRIYNSAGQLTSYKGSLVFQAMKEFPVNPMEEIAAHMGTVVA